MDDLHKTNNQISHKANNQILFVACYLQRLQQGAINLFYLNFPSRKHAHIVLTPLNPTFIWGLQRYTLFFLFLLKNIDCGYSLEPPRRGGSNEYPQSMF